eukprot:52219-Lingulodinium_polyedra.AAC.1
MSGRNAGKREQQTGLSADFRGILSNRGPRHQRSSKRSLCMQTPCSCSEDASCQKRCASKCWGWATPAVDT